MSPIDVYRIGLGDWLRRIRWVTHAESKRTAFLYLVRIGWRDARRRSWWGLWQGEWSGCERAVRGLTEAHCRRRTLAAYEQWVAARV